MALRDWVQKGKSRLLTREFWEQDTRLRDMERRLRSVQEALGRVENRQLQARADTGPTALADQEFRVYSQWGEDGLIQHLIRHVPVERELFVEFGVESYEEANTRFLLVNNNWSGLVMDGSAGHVSRIRRSRAYWLYNLKATRALITRENINDLLREQGVTGPIGLLSIDIDGMDYWVWEAIDVIDPAIVVIEYNYRFGPDAAVTVPYDPAFDRHLAHSSLLYYGASLKALAALGARKGYALVGVGSAGLNAFFVKRDRLAPPLVEVSPEKAYRPGRFCEAHDEHGRRVKMTNQKEHELVMELPLEEVETRPPDAPATGGG